MKAFNIVWATDGEDMELPMEIEIPDVVDEEEITDYLSNTTGWLVESYELD